MANSESNLNGISKDIEIPKWDAPLLETPEAAAPAHETPEQTNLRNIAIALRGIEAQLFQLNKSLKKK